MASTRQPASPAWLADRQFSAASRGRQPRTRKLQRTRQRRRPLPAGGEWRNRFRREDRRKRSMSPPGRRRSGQALAGCRSRNEKAGGVLPTGRPRIIRANQARCIFGASRDAPECENSRMSLRDAQSRVARRAGDDGPNGYLDALKTRLIRVARGPASDRLQRLSSPPRILWIAGLTLRELSTRGCFAPP